MTQQRSLVRHSRSVAHIANMGHSWPGTLLDGLLGSFAIDVLIGLHYSYRCRFDPRLHSGSLLGQPIDRIGVAHASSSSDEYVDVEEFVFKTRAHRRSPPRS
jgi:hypothetical protein